MAMKRFLWLAGIIPILLACVIPGCSDKTFTSSTSIISQDAAPTAYIPLEQGLRIGYVVLEPENQHFDIEVTDQVTVAGYPGYTIRKTDHFSNDIDIFYRYKKDDAIFETQSISQPGECILAGPFVIGNSWDRYDTSTTTQTVYDDFQDDETDDNKEGPGDSYKTKPGGDYSIMTIVGIENITALNGSNYGNCIKVAWPIGDNAINYFWYAPGIGLVKFEQDVTTQGVSEYHSVGVMADYQIVHY